LAPTPTIDPDHLGRPVANGVDVPRAVVNSLTPTNLGLRRLLEGEGALCLGALLVVGGILGLSI